ncbi:unnamed protein product [Sphagnum balticum]
MGAARKMVVEVTSARGLMPKDGQGSANPYCVLDYDGQRKRTKVKSKDLDPNWNEKFEFLVPEDSMLPGDLEITIQNERNSGTGRRSSFLGRVVVSMSNIPNQPEPVKWYPLQKRGLFSHIKGDLGLRAWITVDKPSKAKDDKRESKKDEKEGGQTGKEGGGVETPKGEAGDEKPRGTKKEAKADKQPEPPRPNLITVPEADFTVKETNPDLGKAIDYKQHYDLVEQMTYLFVRVVRAQGLMGKYEEGKSDPYVRLTVGAVKTESKIIKSELNPEWNQIFAVGKDKIQGGTLELSVWDADNASKDNFLGGLMFDLAEVPQRKPPENPLAPQWYKLEAKTGRGREIMVAIWWGTQADEVFPEAWQSDTGDHAHFRSKVYVSPKLWYLRVTIVEAQDLTWNDKSRLPELYIKAHVGPYQMLRSRIASVRSASPFWNEDLLFVAMEPFDDLLHILVQDRVEEILGQVRIPLSTVEHRIDGHQVASRWYILEKEGGKGGGFLGRIHLRLSVDGGYHVMDESSNYISCTRPTAKQLWKPSVGVLELGIHGANNLLPMKTTKDNRGSTDAYCVAKYGPKWIRTRTIFKSFNPRWNEQYTWEVYDPCTVVTVGVFDNRHAHSFPGDKMVTAKDLPVGKFMLDTEAERWSMRRSKANYYRIMGVLNGVLAVMNWFSDICNWKSPVTTVLVHILLLILVWHPELLLPTIFLYMFLIGAWNYRFRSRTPPFMDAKLSQGQHVGDLDELEEEFNVVPANRAQEVLKHRYERLRGVAGRLQNALGELATTGEQLHSLLSWRDPRATAIFVTFCLVTAIVLYATPFQAVAVLLGVYVLRHPRFRDPLPAIPINFFNPLPSQSDRIL